MTTDVHVLKTQLLSEIDRLWEDVDWTTPRPVADRRRWEVVQRNHRYQRLANPTYRERCEREGVGETLTRDDLATVALPEEIFKSYREQTLANGERLGIFCERNVPLLLEGLNRYLTEPITMEGLSSSYLAFTSLRGGLDQLRRDLLEHQGVYLLTSSGTGGGAFALIPSSDALTEEFRRVNHSMFGQITTVPGYGPLNPATDCLVGYGPRDGSMMMAFGLKLYADLFEDRAMLAIDAEVYTRELRWRKGVFTGVDGMLLKVVLPPALSVVGKRMSKQSAENFHQALVRAEKLGVRTLVFANPWMALNAVRYLQRVLEAKIAAGEKKPGDPLVELAPGSVLLLAGGNKSGSDIPLEEIVGMFQATIGGVAKVVDAYGQGEALSGAVMCSEGNYHFDPHVEPFQVNGYLATYETRQFYRPSCMLTGDVIDGIHEEPCPCGQPTRYFTSVARDNENRGTKGCAAALAEYG
jgi:hypothetical protein